MENVTKEEAGDCEAKLIQYYRTLKADGEEFTLNAQLEPKQTRDLSQRASLLNIFFLSQFNQPG